MPRTSEPKNRESKNDVGSTRASSALRKASKPRTSRRRALYFVFTLVAVIIAASLATPLVSAYADSLLPPDIYWYTDDPQANEYVIHNGSEFRGLVSLVNGTAVDEEGNAIDAVGFEGKVIKQEGNIVLSAPLSPQRIEPVGTAEHPFAGTYDGQGNTIRGFVIEGDTGNIGLFGVTSATSTLKNISLTSSSMYTSSINIDADTRFVSNVGSLVGRADGLIENCSSRVGVSVSSSTPGTERNPSVVSNVGGLVGYALSDISDSTYRGALTVTVTSDAAGSDLRTCEDIGGVVGRFGEPDKHGTMTNCMNTSSVWVTATGAGSVDRFGVVTYARPYCVGGVCGYANGSVVDCTNGEYDTLYGTGTGTVQTSSEDAPKGNALDGRGGDQVGGIVGSLRGESKDPNRYNDGDPDDITYVRNCHNFGTVTGAVAVGGIAGQAGIYCVVTQSFNGLDEDELVGHVISTRWNKPCTGGILGQGRGASVSYCANYAMIENIQTGYYTAGVVGTLWIGDDNPDFKPELYACFNSGHVYTASREEGVEYRESGIVGSNEGYVHDCVMLFGTVPFHDNSPVGDNDWGQTNNLYVLTQDELQTSYCAALLNEAGDGTWDVYWYMNHTGYPVLNIWETPIDVIPLTSEDIASVEVIKVAGYIGEGKEPVPTLSITLTNGRKLWQNTDFYVTPQKGAWEITRDGEEPYLAGIVGLGCYTGTVEGVCHYGIGKGDLSYGSVVVSGGKYSLGQAVYPQTVRLIMAGADVDTASYSYRIYDYNTSQLDDGKPHYVVYDSEGYASFDGGLTLVDIADASLEGDYLLYDRNHCRISDSSGAVYDPATGGVVSGTYACIYYRSGAAAGYVVEVSARTSAVKFTGSVCGRYVVSTASLKDDVSVDSISVGDTQWYWDNDTATMYMLDAAGKPVSGYPYTTFTGESIQPDFSLSYLGSQLTKNDDYLVIYGDPNGSGVGEPNVNATTADNQAGVVIRSADSRRYSNYLTAFFDIKPAKLEDCSIQLENDEYAFTGTYITPKVNVTLNGVTLKEGRDYTLEYKNNLRRGVATCTVHALPNLLGGQMTDWQGTFEITSGKDLSQYSIDKMSSTYYNFGARPKTEIRVRNQAGEDLGLVEGRDYSVTFSQYSVGDSTVTITGMGVYSGTLSTKVLIKPYDVEADPYDQIDVEWQDMVYGTWMPEYNSTLARYNIGATCPVANVKMYPILNWDSLQRGPTPYTQKSAQSKIGNVGASYFDASGSAVSYRSAQPGTLKAEVSFSLYGNASSSLAGCTGTLSNEVEYTKPVDLATAVVWGIDGACYYTGNAYTPVIGKNPGSGNLLREGIDYTIEYSDNTNVGLASYKISAVQGSLYTGTYTSTFAILPIDLTTASSVKRIDAQRFTGSAIEPKPIVVVGGKTLIEGTDYTLSYLNNVEAGKATVYVTGMGNYGGRTSSTFNIVADPDVTIVESWVDPIADQVYTGRAITPALSIANGSSVLIEGTDYSVEYTDNTKVGTAHATVHGIGSYTGTVSLDFTIIESDDTVYRLAGDSSSQTAASIVDEAYGDNSASSYAVLVRDDDFADAMSATGLAGALDAPILLTDRNSLTQAAADEISRLDVSTVYIIGGTGAMPGDFEDELRAYGVDTVERVFGESSWDTSVACAEKIMESGGSCDKAIIAMSGNFQDALSMSSFAYRYGVPIFLEDDHAQLPSKAQSLLVTSGGFASSQVYVAGGAGAVPEDSLSFLGRDYVRLYGSDGYGTSNAIAAYFVENGLLSADTVCVASGAQGAKGLDALAGAVLAGRRGGVVLLVSASNAMEAIDYTTIDGFLTAHLDEVSRCFELGGTYVMPRETISLKLCSMFNQEHLA